MAGPEAKLWGSVLGQTFPSMHSTKSFLGRAALYLAGILFVVGFATTPLLRSGLVTSDYRALALAEQPLTLGSLGKRGEDGELHVSNPASSATRPAPLAHLAQKLSIRLAALGERESLPSGAFFLRLEGLLYLAFGALGLALFTRRLLLPWTGSVHAAAAGWASALIFLVHPLASAAVAGVSVRGELLAVVLAVWSGAFFLRGRQDRRIGFTITSFVLCGLGGFASNLTLGLPVLFACAEFASSHRYRTVRGRLRTTMTTLLVFGVAASVDLILHVSRLGPAAFPGLLRALMSVAEPDAVTREARRMLGELGILILPVNSQALGAAGFLLAGGLFLLAAQPALVAARSAPRLWAMLLIFFVIGLGLTLLLSSGGSAPLGAESVGTGAALFSSAALVAAGLGVASTSLSGTRRRLLPWVVALGYAVITHGNSLGWRAAGHATELMAQELSEVVSVFGADPLYLVIDPDAPSMGINPFDADLEWLVPPSKVSSVRAKEVGTNGGSSENANDSASNRPSIRALSKAGLRLLARAPEFRAAREAGLVVLGPAEEGQRPVWSMESARPSVGARFWQNELTSPVLDLDPIEFPVLVARAQGGSQVENLQRIGWTTVKGESGAADLGLWLTDSEGPFGIFDLASIPAWVCSDRIRRVRFDEGRFPLEKIEIKAALAEVREALAPRIGKADWHFAAPGPGLPQSDVPGSHWVLALFDLETYRYVELPVEQESASAETLLVPRAKPIAAALGPGPTLWSLERRVGQRAFVQSTGRRPRR